MIKNYSIISKISIGSFGVIYKAVKNFNYFAIKEIFLKREEKEEIERIKEEAKLLEKLQNCLFNNNEYIVQYFESFEQNDNFYIVMEYCDKGDLDSFIKERKEQNNFLSEDEIWKIFIEISIGIGIIHRNKIIHRDLKPLNIFLTIKNNKKIGDFGVSKLLNNQKKATTITGTFYYLSPEICNQNSYDFKSDIWSLGCILYELCTFNHAFDGNNPVEIYKKIKSGKYEDINSVNKKYVKYSRYLVNMISKILNVNPNNRPSINSILTEDIVLEKAYKFNLINQIKNIIPEVKGAINVFISKKESENKNQNNIRQKSNDKNKKKKDNYKKEVKNNFNKDNYINIKIKNNINNNDKKKVIHKKKEINKKNLEQKQKVIKTEEKNNSNKHLENNELEEKFEIIENNIEHVNIISKDDDFSSSYDDSKKMKMNYSFDITIPNGNINEDKNKTIENEKNENIENEIKILKNEKDEKIKKIKNELNKKDYEYIMNIYEKSISIDNEDEFNKKLNEYLNQKNFSDDLKENLIFLFVDLLSIESRLNIYVN